MSQASAVRPRLVSLRLAMQELGRTVRRVLSTGDPATSAITRRCHALCDRRAAYRPDRRLAHRATCRQPPSCSSTPIQRWGERVYRFITRRVRQQEGLFRRWGSTNITLITAIELKMVRTRQMLDAQTDWVAVLVPRAVAQQTRRRLGVCRRWRPRSLQPMRLLPGRASWVRGLVVVVEAL